MKRLAAESQFFFISFVLLTRQLTSPHFLTPIISRWWCLCPSNQTTGRPNAGRISASKQNSLPPESSRVRHERTTTISLFSVGFFLRSPLVCQSLIPKPFRYPNLYEVRLIPTKRDIAFVEFVDEGSAGVAKDALHNYKLDGENKIKVRHFPFLLAGNIIFTRILYLRLHSLGSSKYCCIIFLSSFFFLQMLLVSSGHFGLMKFVWIMTYV